MNIIAALLIATHGVGPYDWHMSCQRWQERAYEILADKTLLQNVNAGFLLDTCVIK